MSETFFANAARFPHDTVDDETVLIDSETGELFLFTGVGPALWQRFAIGADIDDVIAESVSRYGDCAAEPTRIFLSELSEAQMLIRGEAPSTSGTVPEWPAAFDSPAIERFGGVADIINMDPIHDVDEGKGWPRRLDGAS